MTNLEKLTYQLSIATTSEEIENLTPAIREWMELGEIEQKKIVQQAVKQLNARLSDMSQNALNQAGRFAPQNV